MAGQELEQWVIRRAPQMCSEGGSDPEKCSYVSVSKMEKVSGGKIECSITNGERAPAFIVDSENTRWLTTTDSIQSTPGKCNPHVPETVSTEGTITLPDGSTREVLGKVSDRV